MPAETERRKLARRVAGRDFRPPRHWRRQVPDDLVVLTDQGEALAHIRDAVTFQGWRADRETHTLAVLEALVHVMDWDTGVVSGRTRADLAHRAQVTTRTVTRILAWAIEAGLLVCIERGVSARFLGLEHGRAQSYVITAPMPAPAAEDEVPMTSDNDLDVPPPGPYVGRSSPKRKQTRGEELSPQRRRPAPWPWRDAPGSPTDRGRAAERAFDHIGLPAGLRGHGRGLLTEWWDAGCCVAGIVYMLGNSPDDPSGTPPRCGVLFKARDPLAVIGGRLKKWRGRLDDLPAEFRALSTTERTAWRERTTTLAELDPTPRPTFVPVVSDEVRAAARDAIRATLGKASRR